MSRTAWDALLAQARAAHAAYPVLAEFCAFPDDLSPAAVTPHPHPAAGLLTGDTALEPLHAFGRAFCDAAPLAYWRETWKGTAIGADFVTRFGCYCLIGTGGAFHSRQMSAFVVYMPAGLHYPFHQHPAEELYLVLAGGAEFHRAGEAPQVLGRGEVSFHASDQPHATTTQDAPLLAYVLWRNHLATAPVWTPGQGL